MRTVLLFLLALQPLLSSAQSSAALTGTVTDEHSSEPLRGVTITLYKSGRSSFIITNSAGGFSVAEPQDLDSIGFSMIGHQNKTFRRGSFAHKSTLDVSLPIRATDLDAVLIKPLSAMEIVERAISATQTLLPTSDFEDTFFYREVIKEDTAYFSVAEAIFRSQYFHHDRSTRLSLVRGRSKEDVSYTRLFEDFHPGGGPEGLTRYAFNISFPDFLSLKKMKWFNYQREPTISLGEDVLFVIHFDQKPGVHEALEKGKIYINRQDFSVVRYEAENSPLGMPYVKHLTGTDKLFAELLNIEFKRKGWKKEVSFMKLDEHLVMSHAVATYKIGYKQPKKDLDLDLTIHTELMVTNPLVPIASPIQKGEAWQKKNIIANLPADFDSGFWGAYNVISPTEELQQIILDIGKTNHDETHKDELTKEWQYFGRNFFTAYQQHDSIVLVPIMKAAWEDGETGGMIYQTMDKDFTIETGISLTKRSSTGQLPDNGFQQAGIIIRNDDSKEEQSVLLSIGTGGNSVPKYFLRNTSEGKSKGPVDKIDGMNQMLRLEKKGGKITAWRKSLTESNWQKIAEYSINWAQQNLQVGLIVMARFAGGGPKAKPDIKATFTNLRIVPN